MLLPETTSVTRSTITKGNRWGRIERIWWMSSVTGSCARSFMVRPSFRPLRAQHTGHRPEPPRAVDSRIACNAGAWSDIGNDAGLRCEAGAGADTDVIGDARL